MSNGRKNSLKYSYPWILCALLITITSLSTYSDATAKNFYNSLTDTVPTRDTVPLNDSIPLNDTLPRLKDSLAAKKDTIDLNLSKDTLDEPISYKASDSIVFIVPEKKIILYTKGNVK